MAFKNGDFTVANVPSAAVTRTRISRSKLFTKVMIVARPALGAGELRVISVP
jgi:hypothetical protein